jgi:hypothetical protein
MVRGKFTLQSITQNSYGGDGRTLVFTAQYDPELSEDAAYSKATPTGRIEMTVDNPAALKQFKLGVAIYVDFHTSE